MKKKNLFFAVIFLVLAILLYASVYAQEVDFETHLDKSIYFNGDTIEIITEIFNKENSELILKLFIEFETIDGRETDISPIQKQITIPARKSHLEISEVGAVVGGYFTRVYLEDSKRTRLGEKRLSFKVYSKPLSLSVRTCKDYNCEEISSGFIFGEGIFLLVDTDEEAFIEGVYTNPKGERFDLKFSGNRVDMVASEIGEHTVVVRAIKKEQSAEETVYFTVSKGILGQKSGQETTSKTVFLILLVLAIVLLVVVVGVALYLFYKKKKVLKPQFQKPVTPKNQNIDLKNIS